MSAQVTSPSTLNSLQVVVTGENLEQRPVTYRVRSTRTGLANVRGTLTSTSDALLAIQLEFKAPYSLKPGVYTDSLIIDACSDSNCDTLVPGLNVATTVTYTIEMPPGASAPGVSIATNALDVRALVIDNEVPQRQIPLTFRNLERPAFVQVAYTSAAVSGSVFFSSNNELGVGWRSPSELGKGSFRDVITITACIDPQCVNPLPESPINVTVDLSVTDTVDGPSGYQARLLDATADRMVWDPRRQVFYLVSSQDAPFRIRTLEPVSGTITETQVSYAPGPAAISDDGEYLYVSDACTANAVGTRKVRRLKLPGFVEEATIDLGVDSSGTLYCGSSISVAPQQPLTIALVRVSFDSPANLMVFDGTTPRALAAAAAPLERFDSITWSNDTSRIFASGMYGDTFNATSSIAMMSVDASGALFVQRQSPTTPWEGGGLGNTVRVTADGLLYTETGQIRRAATMAVVLPNIEPPSGGPGTAPYYNRLIPDPSLNRIFALVRHVGGSMEQSSFRLTSFDLTERTFVASTPVEQAWNVSQMERWGTDGLALLVTTSRFQNRVVLISGAFFRQ